MTGERELIAMRRAGITPRCVWVADSDDAHIRQAARDWHFHPNPWTAQHHANLRIEAADIPEALDLRCVIGMECHVRSDCGPDRFHRIFDALKAAGASFVVGVINNEVRHERTQREAIHG